jgi:hypothetical protein
MGSYPISKVPLWALDGWEGSIGFAELKESGAECAETPQDMPSGQGFTGANTIEIYTPMSLGSHCIPVGY